MKNPPILISVIGFFAALAGFGFLFAGLRMLGFDWFGVLGDLPVFEKVGLWGWLAIATGLAWLFAAFGLWALQPWARMFAIIMAGFALFEAVLAFFQFPGMGVGLVDGDHAGPAPVVPELHRRQGRIRRAAAGSRLTTISHPPRAPDSRGRPASLGGRGRVS